jgi:hypothetical protein
LEQFRMLISSDVHVWPRTVTDAGWNRVSGFSGVSYPRRPIKG